MTSSDMAGETQPGFVFGNGEANLPRKHVPPDSTEPPQDEPTPTEMVNLRRCDLTCVPDRVLGSSDLTYLCLEGNQIHSVPASLFCSLPRLQWLDLRKNLITCLPPEIGSHRSLRNLLLEANPISELPAELGNVITLRGLSLRGCPIRFPPKEVLHQGCRSVLQYLRGVLAQREVTERKSLPAEEQLRLSELTESSVEEQEESADEDGLQRFRELKDELISLEKAEVAAMAQSRRKSQLLPAAKRKGSTTKAGIMPELRLLGSQYCGRSGERGEPARREQREKQALLEKEKKGALQKHRKQAKTRGRQRKAQEAVSESPAEGSTGPSTERKREEDRSARELERHIRAHVKRMQERRGNPGGTMAPQTAVTEEDVEEIRKLQARLLERKNLGRPSENTFTIYTADTWPSFLFK
uniref:Leucine rich repeat containing 27 n=1 Tax=Fundulus heteroclitus TaxID=8078 RepID=A0A147AB01_FUNHE